MNATLFNTNVDAFQHVSSELIKSSGITWRDVYTCSMQAVHRSQDATWRLTSSLGAVEGGGAPHLLRLEVLDFDANANYENC